MSPDSEGKPETWSGVRPLRPETGDLSSTCVVSPVVLAVLSVGQLRGGHGPQVDDGQEESPSAQHQGGQAVGGGVD